MDSILELQLNHLMDTQVNKVNIIIRNMDKMNNTSIKIGSTLRGVMEVTTNGVAIAEVTVINSYF